MINIIKTIIIGIIEGITEWLPVSSTGHMIIANEFLKIDVSPEFWSLFEVVIQLGAIFAVVIMFFKELFPWGGKTKAETKKTFSLWFKIAVSCIPLIFIGLFLDDYINDRFYNPWTVSIMLIFYGILFIVIEKQNKNKKAKLNDLENLSYKQAFLLGLIQSLAVIPGTSRSGVSILGGLLMGLDRSVIASYTFYLAVPVMGGASCLKVFKYVLNYGLSFTSSEIIILVVGLLTAFIISIFTIRFLLKYIKKNDFTAFGYYRIILGIVVILYFLLK